MKAHSGSTSEGFLPTTLSGAAPAPGAIAPAPEDPSATFTDFLQQQEEEGGSPNSLSSATASWLDASALPNSAPLSSSASASAGPFVAGPAPALPDATTPAADKAAISDTTFPPYAWLGQTTGHVTTPSPVPITRQPTNTGEATPPSDDGSTGLSSWENTPTPVDSPSAPPFFPSTTTAPSSKGAMSDPTTTNTAFSFFVASQAPRPTPPTNETDQPETSNAETAGANTSSGDTTLPALSLSQYLRLRQSAMPATGLPSSMPSNNRESDSITTGGNSTPAPLPAPATPGACFSPSVAGTARNAAARATNIDPTAPAAVPNPDGTSPILFGSPLATMMIHAAVLGANARPHAPATTASATTTASLTAAESAESSASALSALPGLVKAHNAPFFAEKKSVSTPSERSFIQAGGRRTTSTDAGLSLLAGAAVVQPQEVATQSFASREFSSGKAVGSASAGASGAAGMTNGKKEGDMNATLEMPELVVSSGTNPLVSRTSADVHILLGTNNDFHEALDQVMHVAELSNLSHAGNPLRVAIEIQTPPGAIVNVYVSRQADSSYRAQLSTTDAQALSWVQDQISSLKTANATGTDIRWAPAQLESGSTLSSSSAGSDRDLDWNRDGEQRGYQQPDERPARTKLADDAVSDEEAGFDIPFLETLGAIGRAA